MGFRTLAVSLVGDGGNLRQELLRSAGEVDAYVGRVERTNTRSARSWAAVGAAAATAGVVVVTALGGMGVAAAGFETRMRNVNSIVGATEAGLQGLSGEVLDLSRRLPQDANTLAEGLYDVASSGFAGAEGLEVLDASAQAASAGMTTTANAAQAITAVLNAYGRGAQDATDVSDVLFSTVNLGVVSFDQLTGVVGDVAGSAAAAGIGIDQVGAALAAMTLNGISAAEAGTSLNQLITKLVQPSEALAFVYSQLGYESGAAALQSKGLRQVLLDIQGATGGNIETMLQLFPEIRAARGALSLLSNEGRTYVEVSSQIEDANSRQGATADALAEQSKASAFQLKVMVNEAKAAGIEFGTRLLPGVLAVAGGLREAAIAGGPVLVQAWRTARPVLEDLAAAGVNLWEVLEAIWQAAEPVAGALLQIGGGAVIGTLSALAAALAEVTGFLADNKVLVLAVGSVYLATLVPAVGALTVAFNRMVFTPVVLGLVAVLGGAGSAAGAVQALTASLFSLQAVMTAGIAVAIFGVVNGLNQMAEASRKADESRAEWMSGFDGMDTAEARAQISELTKVAEHAIEVYNSVEGDGFGKTLQLGFNTAFDTGHYADVAKEGKAAVDAIAEIEAALADAEGNVARLGSEYGVTTKFARELAIANNIDLAKPWAEAGPEVEKFRGVVEDWQASTGASLETIAGQAGAASQLTVEAFQAIEDAAASAADGARKAFAGVADVLSGLNKDSDGNVESLESFYDRTLESSSQFSEDIREVAARGLDPQFIQRLLQAGPAQAAPVLEQLVSDSSGRMIELVNSSEAELRRISSAVAEYARVTSKAVSAETDQMTTDLPLAMDIATQKIAQGAGATVESIAAALGRSVPEVVAVAEAFGIQVGLAVATAVQQGIDQNKPKVTVQLSGGRVTGFVQDGQQGYAGGGQIAGPYIGPTADNVLIAATPREFMQPVASVDYYGLGVMEAIRRRQIPAAALKNAIRGYATGGQIGAPLASAMSMTPAYGGTTVVRVPVHETHTSEAPIHIGTLVAADVEDFERQSAARRQRHARMGWAPR